MFSPPVCACVCVLFLTRRYFKPAWIPAAVLSFAAQSLPLFDAPPGLLTDVTFGTVAPKVLSAKDVRCGGGGVLPLLCGISWCKQRLSPSLPPPDRRLLVSRKSVPLPSAVWDCAALLRFCLSDVLPYLASEVEGVAVPRAHPAFPTRWALNEATVRELQIAVREITDIKLVPTADGRLGATGR